MSKSLFFNWSSGKDSALALYYLLRENEWKVHSLFTTVNAENNRINMHGLHEDILKKQVESIGLPLEIMYLPPSEDMESYNRLMQQKMNDYKKKGIVDAAFGDIFLEDLKEYREKQLSQVGVKAHFPLWKRNTKQLIYEFLELGFKSVIVSANGNWFDRDFVGKEVSKELIESLPDEVDPCGENGEFHTFCYDGPIFGKPIAFKIKDKQQHRYANPLKNGAEISFWFCDLELNS